MASSNSINNTIIQSCSSSSSALVTSPRRNYYDVFVSFRGEDTRYNFTDHLFASLQRKGIFAFRDDTKLNKGESIGPELLLAMEDSLIYVVVFSKNYASSTWCLQELEWILHCVQVSKKCVLPIFYDVDPSEVRYQKGNYAEAFSKHEQRFQQDSEMVERWREVLTQVANLSGWDVRHKRQYAEIEKIVEEIMNILDYKFTSLPNYLVGMDYPIEELEKHLLLDLVDDVRVVGICGMGGIGKTTLATALYNKISHQFPVRCLIDDLRKIYRHDGPISVQKQILCQTLGEEYLQICNLYNASNLIQSRLCRVKSLLILDNVDQVEQLEKLAVSREWLGAGSRIIITSRDEHILKAFGVDVVYKVPLLNGTDSLQLFSRKAFKLDHVMTSYDKLASDILWYANGLPLAIKVLGSFLFGRDIFEWKSALARLRDSSDKDIMDVLRLSFDGLENLEKEIFLDISCFFNRREEDYVQKVLNCCGFHADIGLRVLIDKSLISITKEDNIEMHSLLQELGRKIVQENSSKESRKWSRVWLHEQLYDVMFKIMEKKVEALCFFRDKDERRPKVLVMAESLSKMSHLRLLILRNVVFSGNLSGLSNKLRYVEWKNYPCKYFPSSFQPNQLVELIMRHSSVKQLWKHKKYLPNLRILDLSHSKNLRKMPDFGEIPNLERLSFKGCVKLVQMDPSIGVLRKLFFLNLKGCKNLVSIPSNLFGLSSLEILILYGCPKVFRKPMDLSISENASHSQSTTSSILKWTTFRFRSLSDARKDLASCLLPPMLSLYNLLELDISFCGLRQIPDAIGGLHWLERLDLGGNSFVTLPSLRELSRLVYLDLEHCKLLESLPQLPFPTAKHDLHKYNKYKYWKRIGLVIFNCPKLGERECCSSVAFSWMIQFIQARQQSSTAFFNVINIVIPESEIPSWFNNQSVSGSIPIELSPFMHDNEDSIIGIACCAVFSVAPIDPTTTINANSYEIELGFYNNSNHHAWFELFSYVPVILKRDLIAVKSDHMWLIHFTRESFFDILKGIDVTLNHPDDFIMKVVSTNCNVQSCGYHWVYKQDLQLKHGCGNSLDRKCRFLAIEDEAQQPHSSSDCIKP